MCVASRWRSVVVAAFVCLCGFAQAVAAPLITNMHPPPNGTYASSFQITVYFSEEVIVTGTPTLGIQIGSLTRQVPYSGSSSPGGLAFSYEPLSGDNGSLTITGPLSLNGGTIKGAQGGDAVLSFSPLSVPEFIVDTTPPAPPVIITVSPASPIAGQEFTISGTSEPGSGVVFREDTYARVDNGSWVATFRPLAAGTYTYQAKAVDVAGNLSAPATITFTVQPDTTGVARPVVSNATINGELGAPLTPVQVPVTGDPFNFDAPGLAAYGLSITWYGLVTGTPTAAASGVAIPVTAQNAGGTSDPATILLNVAPATAPVVTQVVPPSGTSMNVEYQGWIYITVIFSKPVIVVGTPTLTVRIGPTDTHLRGTSNGQSVRFSFQASDASVQGPLIITGPLSLNGGSIKDADGRDAVLSFDPVATTFVIDTVQPAAPVINGVTPAVPAPGQSFTIFGTAEPGATLWFLLNLVGQTTADANGNWSMSFSGRAPGVYNTLVYAEDALGNDSHWQRGGPSGVPVTVTVQIVVAEQPVVSDTTIVGQVGVPIGPTKVSATNAPTGFSASGLAAYGLSIDSSGLITGTPTAVAADASVAVTASNSAGSSAPAKIRLTISDPPSAPPVITSIQPPPAGTYNGSADWVPVVLVFSKPVTVAGQPTLGIRIGSTAVTLHGSSASGSNLMFRLDPRLIIAQGQLAITGPIDLNGGSIKGPDGTDAILTFTPLHVSDVTVDTIPPPPPPPPTPQTITFVSPTGSVVIGEPITLGATSSAGLPITYTIVSGDASLNGNSLTPRSTGTLIVRASAAGNDTYSAASADVNFGNPQKAAQAISADTSLRTARAGSTVALDATSTSGLPVTYSVVSGAATLTGNSLTLTGPSGMVLVRVSQAGNDAFAPAVDVTLRFEITPIPISRLVNISSRLNVSANNSAGASIAGFVVTGSSPKQFLIRGVGPTLERFGVSSPLAAPQLKLYDNPGNVIATNSGWNNDVQIAAAAAAVGAFGYVAGSRDAALLLTLAPGGYTVHIFSADGGNALIEVYDVSTATITTTHMVNISTRGTVGTGDAVLIGGFVISGNQPKRVLIRGIGPALRDYVSGVLTDSVLTVYDARQNVVARNDDWGVPQPLTPGQQVGSEAELSAANVAAGAFPLPSGSKDAVLLLTLDPGLYSAVVTGANNTTGAAMVEVYEVP